jgi:serine/threonine protein kinase
VRNLHTTDEMSLDDDPSCNTTTTNSTQSSSISDKSQNISIVSTQRSIGPSGDKYYYDDDQDDSAGAIDRQLHKLGLTLIPTECHDSSSNSTMHHVFDRFGRRQVVKICSAQIELTILRNARRQMQMDVEEDAYLVRLRNDDVIDNQILLFTDYCQFGHLGQILERLHPATFTSSMVVRITSGMASGLDFLHLRQIAHRSIRPDHILIDEHYSIRICGLSNAIHCIDGQLKTTTTSTYANRSMDDYEAPELRQFDVMIDLFAVDQYAVGAILYRILMGKQRSLAKLDRSKNMKHRAAAVAWYMDPLAIRAAELLTSSTVSLRPTSSALRHCAWLHESLPQSTLSSTLFDCQRLP